MAASSQRKSETFWSSILHGYIYTPLDLSANSWQASSTFRLCLDENKLSALQPSCKSHNVTIKAALQLAWAVALCQRLYGRSDVVFGEAISTASNLDAEAHETIIGPMINTVPLRVRLLDNAGVFSVATALRQVQDMSDEIRGVNPLASLRGIQALWRGSLSDTTRAPSTLLESLFVFDGVVSSQPATGQLFESARGASGDATDQEVANAPVFDEYPLIANSFTSDDTLCGKLRGNMDSHQLGALGSAVEAVLGQIAFGDLKGPVVDLPAKILFEHGMSTVGTAVWNPSTRDEAKCDAILDLVRSALGSRGKHHIIGHHTKLVNVGVDSIVAIRLANLLRKGTGMEVSVFQIMKDASARDIVENGAADQHTRSRNSVPKAQSKSNNSGLKSSVAKLLHSPEACIISVLPVLSGQRAHLEQWLLHGKRLFEAPWLYRVLDASINGEKVLRFWKELVRIHDILRTTFVVRDKEVDLVQVTLSEADRGSSRFTAIHDDGELIEDLANHHVSDENTKSSDMRRLPRGYHSWMAPTARQ